MGFRFSKSFRLLPGLRLNLSKTGPSVSLGRAPFTLNLGPRGTRTTASLPGTGLSHVSRTKGGRKRRPKG